MRTLFRLFVGLTGSLGLFAQTGPVIGTLIDRSDAVVPNGTVTVQAQSTVVVLPKFGDLVKFK
jgi:hypothetical protein